MKPTNPNIKSLDKYGHTLYLNLSDTIAIYFEGGKPVHVRFWPERVYGKEYSVKKSRILQEARDDIADSLRRMGFAVVLDEWKSQDIDDPIHGGIIAMISLPS